jgi:membrane protease YdiL (CAAX protease family)
MLPGVARSPAIVRAEGSLSATSPRLLASLASIYILFHWLAAALDSTRGEMGVVIALVVVVACLVAECLLFGKNLRSAARALGMGRPAGRGLMTGVTVSAALLLVIPAYTTLTDSPFTIRPGWTALIPGLFAQAGIAEETLFRGYLFRHLRVGRSFLRASLLAMGPFVLVHLALFATMSWPVALAALLLAVIVSFPLAHLFELGASTVWAPAFVHFVIQGAIKVVDVPGRDGELLPLVWMAASACIPLAVFLVPRLKSEPA